MQDSPLILASASPRRRELLASAGFKFTIVPSEADESAVFSARPAKQAEALAARKGLAISLRFRDRFVLAADTVIDLQGQLLGKPADRESAVAMLKRLRGRKHQVITAVFLSSGKSSEVSAVRTTVWMRDVSDAEIRRYADTGEPLDKAGSYAIQGLGSRLVARIEGCYNNVVGLPLCRVTELLDSLEFPALPAGPVCYGPDGRVCPLQAEMEDGQ